MPTFCRHNRFVERCPICSKTLPGQASEAGTPRRASSARKPAGEKPRRRGPRGPGAGVRVHREGRAVQDGYSSALLPGVRASTDASRLAQEIAFSSARLLTLEADPPELYGEVRALAAEDLERATWACLLIAYLSPLEGEEPFAGIRSLLAAAPDYRQGSGALAALAEIPLGPRSSHDRRRGPETLVAYRQWVERAAATTGDGGLLGSGGAQARAFSGDPSWSPERRFERVFERLALPGFGRMGRYELLLMLGRLGIYELRPGSLHLAGARGLSVSDPTTLAAKRVFAIGDPLLLERRAAILAEAVSVPVETLELALANWASPQRATLGFPAGISDGEALERAADALGL
jgi:hypothetical protein